MANGTQLNGVAKLALQLVVILVTVAVGWGFISHQVGDNTDDIEKVEIEKVDNDIFIMHCEQQKQQAEKSDKWMERIDGKIDRLLSGSPEP